MHTVLDNHRITAAENISAWNIIKKVDQYPLSPSERYIVDGAQTLEHISWVREKYGEDIAALISVGHFGAPAKENVQRAQAYTRYGLQALHIPTPDFTVPRDIQTGYMLAKDGQQAIDVLKSLSGNIQRGINSLQIHRSGVTGIEANPVTVFLPSALKASDVMQTYMTSVPQITPRCDETESHMQQRLIVERKHAFALYSDLVKAEQLKGLDSADLQNILEVCFRLTNGQQPSFVLTTGYGGSEDLPSTRMPSYISGASEIMGIFLKHQQAGSISCIPRFRILHAHKIAGLVNRMDGDRVRLAAKEMQHLLRAFLDHFMPDISEHTSFETDEDISFPSTEDAQHYFSRLPIHDPSHQEIQVQAERMIEKERLGIADAMARVQQYTVAHIPLFLERISPQWHGNTPYAGKKPDIVWSIGGDGERLFNRIRKKLNDDWNTFKESQPLYGPISIRTIQKAGKYPPYYHLNDHDTSVQNIQSSPSIIPDCKAIKNKALSNALSADYAALLNMAKKSVAKKQDSLPTTITDAQAETELKIFFLNLLP